MINEIKNKKFLVAKEVAAGVKFYCSACGSQIDDPDKFSEHNCSYRANKGTE